MCCQKNSNDRNWLILICVMISLFVISVFVHEAYERAQAKKESSKLEAFSDQMKLPPEPKKPVSIHDYDEHVVGDKNVQRPLKVTCNGKDINQDLGRDILYVYSKNRFSIMDDTYRYIYPNDMDMDYVQINSPELYKNLYLNHAYNCNFACNEDHDLVATSCDYKAVEIPEQEDKLLEERRQTRKANLERFEYEEKRHCEELNEYEQNKYHTNIDIYKYSKHKGGCIKSRGW